MRNHPLAATADRPVVVVGASLGGLAAAVRLARVGHHVVVLDAAPEPSYTWRSRPVVDLPAAWRDLFRKSGRILDAALALEGYELSPAPATRHEFEDGSTLDLPSDRGEQHAAVVGLAGDAAARAWRDVLDAADTSWQQVRLAGLEAEARGTEPYLRERRTVEDVASTMPDERLAALVRSVAYRLGSEPVETPEWLLSRVCVDRVFGRWLVTRAGEPQPAETLVRLLHRRAADRGVELRWGVSASSVASDGVTTDHGEQAAAAVISALGHSAHGSLVGTSPHVVVPRRWGPLRVGTREVPPLPPRSEIVACDPGDGPVEVVRHTAAGVRVTWTLGDRALVSSGAPSSAGVRWRGPGTVAAFHPVAGEHCTYAGSGTVGGAEPWAQLLVGALATYRVHDALTADDIRPSNKAYRP